MKKRIGKVTVGVGVCLYLVFMMFAGVWDFMQTRAVAEPLDTYHGTWNKVRAQADEDGATFSAVYDLTTEGNFAQKGELAFKIPPLRESAAQGGYSKGAVWIFAIAGKNFNNTDDTYSFDMIGWGRDNGMLQVIATGDGVLGTQAVIVLPEGGDAQGQEFSVTDANYTHATTTLTVTDGGFAGGVVNTLVYVGSSNETNLTSGYYEITTFTDANTIVISGAASTDNITAGDITVQNNPLFWSDTINLDVKDPLRWPGVAVKNSGNNEVCIIIVHTTGLEFIQFVLYDADGATGEEAGELSVYGRRY